MWCLADSWGVIHVMSGTHNSSASNLLSIHGTPRPNVLESHRNFSHAILPASDTASTVQETAAAR